MAHTGVKCTLCDKGFPTFHKTKNGKLRSGQESLEDHIDNVHNTNRRGFVPLRVEGELAFLFLLADGFNKVEVASVERKEWGNRFVTFLRDEYSVAGVTYNVR